MMPSPLDFFGRLVWLDGRPLLDTIEPYRRALFMRALYTFRDDKAPLYNLVLAGRAKKNWKSADLILAALYKTLIPVTDQGNEALIIANTEDQAGDDLDLAKKLVRCNPALSAELDVWQKSISRRDGRGSIKIVPGRDAVGLHGKTSIFTGFDEIHGARDWDQLEALQHDPTRADALTWITSYDTIYNSAGVPLYDLKQRGFAGDDPRFLFSWYSGDVCTDPDFAELPPEERANPSMVSWPEGAAYLEQQKRRLPSNKYRRLHLNLPGATSGAFLDSGAVFDAIVTGRKALPPLPHAKYAGFVDMSGGSNDDACLGIAHREGRIIIVDLVEKQAGRAPFNPRDAVKKFAQILRQYGVSAVHGDAYAGQTFRKDFEAEGIKYIPCKPSATDIYEAFEPKLNAGEIELPDNAHLQEQLLGLVIRGARVDHAPGQHDDHAVVAAGAVWAATDAPKREIGVAVFNSAGGGGRVYPVEPRRERQLRIVRCGEETLELTPSGLWRYREGAA